MNAMTPPPGTVTGGVDTPSDMRVAAALDHLGGVLGTAQSRTSKRFAPSRSRWGHGKPSRQ